MERIRNFVRKWLSITALVVKGCTVSGAHFRLGGVPPKDKTLLGTSGTH